MAHRIPAGQSAKAAPANQRPSDTARLTLDEYLDEQEAESFPASDPHSDWAGPPTRTQHRPAPRPPQQSQPPQVQTA